MSSDIIQLNIRSTKDPIGRLPKELRRKRLQVLWFTVWEDWDFQLRGKLHCVFFYLSSEENVIRVLFAKTYFRALEDGCRGDG